MNPARSASSALYALIAPGNLQRRVARDRRAKFLALAHTWCTQSAMKSDTGIASKRRLIGARRRIAARASGREPRRETLLELLDQLRNAFVAPAAVTDRVIDRDSLGLRAVGELHLNGVADRTLVGVEVVATERRDSP